MRSPIVIVALLQALLASAFQGMPPPLSSSLRLRRIVVAKAVSVDASSDTGGRPQDLDAPHADILRGRSPKAVRLRKQLEEIWSSPDSVSSIVLMGPKGSGKSSIVDELVERLPSWQTQSVTRLSLDNAIGFMDLTLGTPSTTGLFDQLADQVNTTLVIRGFKSKTVADQDDLDRRQELEQTVTQLVTQRTLYCRSKAKDVPFQPRIIYSLHETHEPDFLTKHKNQIVLIKIPDLNSRAKDMEVIAAAKLGVLEREYGLRNVRLSTQANHRLLDHTWADGEPELDQELRNALLRLALEQMANPYYLVDGPRRLLLQSKHMLTQNPTESMRRRILYDFPQLRRIIQSPWIFDHTLRYIVTPVFVAFLVVLFWGPQTRELSSALTVFWAGWWPLCMLSFPFLGRIWCSICPFMAVGTLAQELATKVGVQLKKWPKWVDQVGAAFAFWLFFGILVWEELWNLPQNGALSAWLLLLITSGAVFNSVQFEDRMWCRHLCPIGAMCRTFGTMSMTEVRSFKANCQGCTNPQCVNGDSPIPDPSDTFALKGCTMGLKNNQLRDMGHCTLCMSCVKNCDKEVPEVNTRPLGIDYGLPWLIPTAFQDPNNLAVSQVETNFWMGALLTVLQGSVLVHYMPRIFYDLGIDPAIATSTPSLDFPFYAHAAATVALLALPGLMSLFVDKVANPLEGVLMSLRSTWGKPTAEAEGQRKMIIDTYESVLRSDKSLQETLEEFDPDGDGQIALWEFERALKDLGLPVTQSSEYVMDSIRRRIGDPSLELLPTEGFLDAFQQLYLEARGDDDDESLTKKFKLETKKTFVELFNDLDRDGDGFILPGDFDYLVDRVFQSKRTWEEKLELFRRADVVGQGRLNLFEFMAMMRKIAQAGIQEIGYGYLPLAWATMTAYWLGLGLKELGLVFLRLPDTFYLSLPFHLPSLVASDGVVELVQTALVIGAIPPSISLTQKLCNDNKIGGLRFGLHAGVQVIGAWTILYLMISPNPLATLTV